MAYLRAAVLGPGPGWRSGLTFRQWSATQRGTGEKRRRVSCRNALPGVEISRQAMRLVSVGGLGYH